MEYFSSLKNLKDKEPNYVPLNFNFVKVEYDFDTILRMLNDPNTSDLELNKQIMFRINDYLDIDNIKDSKLHSSMVAIWTNLRFLNIISQIITEDNTNVILIMYDMLTSIDNLTDDHKKLIYQIIYKVLYRKYILPLSSVVDKEDAKTLSLMRFSSLENKDCIMRVNKCITMLRDLKVNDIVYIYNIFFFNQFSNLFNYTMSDTKDYSSLNSIEKETYNKISTAICYILENMPLSDIDRVLKRYTSYIELLGYDSILRFSIKDLSDIDFPRIKMVVTELIVQGYNII